MKKRLISSYNEEKDTFVGKIEGQNGYCADIGISDGIYLGINNHNYPTQVFIPHISEVLNVSKQDLESSNIKININCDENSINFEMFAENSKICSIKCENKFQIQPINCLMDSNI